MSYPDPDARIRISGLLDQDRRIRTRAFLKYMCVRVMVVKTRVAPDTELAAGQSVLPDIWLYS